ncbi:hypothetical protein LXL04_029611 [Taraxacum kok-saghyz]
MLTTFGKCVKKLAHFITLACYLEVCFYVNYNKIQLQHKFWQPNVQQDSITAQFNYNSIQLQQNSITAQFNSSALQPTKQALIWKLGCKILTIVKYTILQCKPNYMNLTYVVGQKNKVSKEKEELKQHTTCDINIKILAKEKDDVGLGVVSRDNRLKDLCWYKRKHQIKLRANCEI